MRIRALFAAFFAALFLLTACTGSSGTSGNNASSGPLTYDNSASVLNIVAGSEQQSVLDLVVKPWCQQNKLTCNFTSLGSVDQARLLKSGNAPYDAFWFASSVFAQLGDEKHVLTDVKPMSVTPLVFAGWKSEMQRLGFVGRDVTIDEVLQALVSHQTKTWITNPTQSNSGATVLFSFLNHFAGNATGVPLSQAQLDSPKVQEGITQFAHAFAQTPPSTGTLMKQCLARPNDCRTMFTYEDLVIENNKQLVADHKEPLYAVYPKGGLAISDAPLGFLPHGNNSEKAANFKKLQDYLLSSDAQQKLLELGRRPATSIGLSLTNAPANVFNPDWGIRTNLREQPITYPSAAVIQAALDNYQTSYRTPGDDIYCIDGSGSMGDNGGWDGVDASAKLLFDPAQASQYLLQTNSKDRTTVMIFSGDVKAGPWTVTGNDPNQLLDLKNKIQGQGPGGDTGIFHCLGKAADWFRSNPSGDRKRILILMSDGRDSYGDNGELKNFMSLGIPVIAIGFGNDADSSTLGDIAKRTGGVYIGAGNDLVSALRTATGWR